MLHKDTEMSNVHVKKVVGMGPLPSHGMIRTTEVGIRKRNCFPFSLTFVDHNSAVVEKMALQSSPPYPISAFSSMPNSLFPPPHAFS
jgi:hypothetical protein